jgi:hypothetical protein
MVAGNAAAAHRGSVTPSPLGAAGDAASQALFAVFDADGDGVVTQEEIQAMMPDSDEKRKIDETKGRGVIVGVFTEYILGEIADEEAFMSLFATLLNIVSFFVICIALLSHHEVYAVQDAIQADLVNHANFAYVDAAGWAAVANQTNTIGLNTMYDVGNVADFWSWLRLGAAGRILAPAYVSEMNADWETHAVGLHGPGQVVRFNHVVGWPRLSQERGAERDCIGEPPKGAAKCIDPYSRSRASFEYKMDPRSTASSIDPTEKVVWLDPTKDAAAVDAQLVKLEGSSWIDYRTHATEFRTILHNPTYGVVTRVRIMFLFSRGGGIFPSITSDSIRLSDPYDYMYDAPVVLAFVYYGFITLYMTVSELKEIYECALSGNFISAIKDYYCDPGGLWNLVDGFAIVVTYLSIFNYFQLWQSQDVLKDEIERFNLEPTLGEDELPSLYAALDVAVGANVNFCTGLVLYAVSVVLRLFKTFSSQPRLAVVIECLNESLNDVFHFFVVFLTIFALWSIIGVITFGHSCQEFADFSSAFLTCLYLIMGEMDLETLEAAGGRFATAGWVISFFVMIVLLMLNMLLAIIFEKYSLVQGNVGPGAKTLWFQMYEVIRRQLQTFKKKRVTLPHVIESLRKDFAASDPATFGAKYPKEQVELLKAESTYLPYEELLAKVPGMPRSQAERLGKKAWGTFDGTPAWLLEKQEKEEAAEEDPRREKFLEVIKAASEEPAGKLLDQNGSVAADAETSAEGDAKPVEVAQSSAPSAAATAAMASTASADREVDRRLVFEVDKRLVAVERQLVVMNEALMRFEGLLIRSTGSSSWFCQAPDVQRIDVITPETTSPLIPFELVPKEELPPPSP